MIKKSTFEFKIFLVNCRKQIIVLVALFFLIIYLVSFITPKIYIETEINDVLNRDYTLFINNNDNIPEEMKNREYCRFVSLSFKIKTPFLLIRNIKIERVSLKQYIHDYAFNNKLNNELKSIGYYNYSGNHNFTEGINIYINGLTEEKVKDTFKDYFIIVKWTDYLNIQHKQIYHMMDYIG